MSTPKQTTQRSPAWRQRFRGQFVKTRMCRFHAAGQCRFEEGCPFAHCEEELGDAPDLRKTSLCTAFKKGTCPLPSEECPYAHGDEELCLTQAFVEKPLSKRIRSLAMKEGLLPPDEEDSASNPQDGDQCFLEETKEPLPPSPQGDCEALKKTRRQRRRNTGRDYTKLTLPLPANQQEPDQELGTILFPESPLANVDGTCTWPHAWRSSQADMNDSMWVMTYIPSPTFASKHAPWAQMSQIPLIPPMFENAPPEAVADLLRSAMPEFYED